MQTSLFPTHVYVKYELSFMISPPSHIKDYVRRQKKLTHAMVGSFRSAFYPAHISLGKLLIRDDQIKERIEEAKNSLERVYEFPIYFNGFNAFQESNTIYVNIANPNSILEVFQSLFVGSPPTPHMTIAESLSDEQYYRAWKHFQHKLYFDRALCNDILVLGKPFDSNSHWKEIEKIPLKPRDSKQKV